MSSRPGQSWHSISPVTGGGSMSQVEPNGILPWSFNSFFCPFLLPSYHLVVHPPMDCRREKLSSLGSTKLGWHEFAFFPHYMEEYLGNKETNIKRNAELRGEKGWQIALMMSFDTLESLRQALPLDMPVSWASKSLCLLKLAWIGFLLLTLEMVSHTSPDGKCTLRHTPTYPTLSTVVTPHTSTLHPYKLHSQKPVISATPHGNAKWLCYFSVEYKRKQL